ncbi:MAG: autotransporter-associated beta strand repeat-containing protein [Opitutaceae bacterium]|jgi:autotransporter-associated beta strand protein
MQTSPSTVVTLLAALAGFLAPLPLSAQTTVTYTDTQISTTARATTPADPLTFTIASGTATENGVVSGTGSLTKTGAGTLRLGATNTYTGGTFVNAGTIELGANNALGTGAITITGGGLRAAGEARTLTNALFTSGSITVGRSTTFAGTTTLNAATTIIASNPDGPANSDTTFSGPISGSFGVTLAEGAGGLGIGSGNIVFSGANTYTGGTTLRTRLLINSDAALGAASGALTMEGGTLRATTSIDSTRAITLGSGGGTFEMGNSSSFSGTVSGSGALTKSGAGTLTLSGANTYTGGTTISAGQITMGSASALGGTGTISVATGATLNAGAYDLDVGRLAGTGQAGTSGNLVFSSGTVTNTNSLFGANLIVNGGELTLAGSLSAGQTDLNGGVLNIASSAAMSATGTDGYNFRGGTLRYLMSGTVNMPPVDTQLYADGVEQYIKVDVTAGNSVTWNGAQLYKFTPDYGLSRVDFTKLGAGTLRLFAGALYTQAGTFRIEEGSLILDTVDLGTLGAAYDYGTGRYPTNIVNNGNLTLVRFGGTQTGTHDHWGVISGTGSLTTGENATVNLYNNNTYTGATTVGAGTTLNVRVTNAIGVASAVTVNGTLNLHGNTQTVGSLGGAGSLDLGTGGVFTAGGNDTSTTFSGTITGGSTLTKAGEGTLTLSGNNSAFTGAITLEGGALALGSATAIGDSSTGGAISFQGGALQYSASNNVDYSARFTSAAGQAFAFDTGGANVTFTGALVSAGGTLTKSGAGTLTLAAANTYSGATSILGGTLALGANNSIANSSNVTIANATLALGAYNETVGSVSLTDGAITGTGTLTSSGGYTVASGTISASLAGTSSLQKTGEGDLSLSGDNSYTGGTTLGGGTVTLGSNTALGTGAVNLAGSALQASGARTLANALSLTGDTTFTGNFTFTGGLALTSLRELTIHNTTTFAGVISGSKTLFKSGAGEMVLTGANTYTGGTFIGEGTVRINNTTGSAFGTGAVTVASGATLTGAGSFTGAFQNNGTYAPGNSPTLATHASFSQGSTGILVMELGGLARGTGYDALDITGSFTPGGTLTVSLIDGFQPALGNSFDLFNFSSIGGTFATLNLADISGSGLTWDTSALYTAGILSVISSSVPEPSTYAALLGAVALGFVACRRRRT